ncbi:MAG: hypothetical protein ACP5QK_04165 [Myxococcota bacterium]
MKEKCYSNEDCSDGKICNMNNGECYYECKNDSDCPLTLSGLLYQKNILDRCGVI